MPPGTIKGCYTRDSFPGEGWNLDIFEPRAEEYGALVVRRVTDGPLDLGTLAEEFEERGRIIREASMDTGGY